MKFTARASDASHVRQTLDDLGVFYTEERHLIFWREFTITGPAGITDFVFDLVNEARIADAYGLPGHYSVKPEQTNVRPGVMVVDDH